MRKLYSLAMYLGTPLILAHLAVRGVRDRAYLCRWNERFARLPSLDRDGIVVHAASVGEVNAAAPLVQALLKALPDTPLTLTTFTPTGSARARALFGNRVAHTYIPVDLPGAVSRFLDRLQPRLLVIMETEIWPNLFAAAAKRSIPIAIANARMSQRSLEGYRRFEGLAGAALRSASLILAQSEQDAERYRQAGAPGDSVEVSGNLKFDMSVPPGLAENARRLRQQWGADRPVLLAASTHEADDLVVLESFGRVLDANPDALLIIVPRHPERFAAVAEVARGQGLKVELRSQTEACGLDTQCFVIDAMGELMNYYACCDIAVVGGSFGPVGGHNLLEPAALGLPVITGPHTFNFEDITRHLLQQGAALQVRDGGELAETVNALFRDSDRRARMGRAALEVVDGGRGALDLTLSRLRQLLG